MYKCIIGYGLSGGFGGINSYEIHEVHSKEKADKLAWELAIENYESYVGMYGLRTQEEIMEEELMEEDDAHQQFCEEREDWIEYCVYPYTIKNCDNFGLEFIFDKELFEKTMHELGSDYICIQFDAQILEYLDDDWEDEFDSEYDAYIEQGRGEAEYDILSALISHIGYDINDLSEEDLDWIKEFLSEKP